MSAINLNDPRFWSPAKVLENAPGLNLKQISERVTWVGEKIGYSVGSFRLNFTDIATWTGEQTKSGSVVKLSSLLEELHFGTWEDALNFLTANDNEQAKRYYNAHIEMQLAPDEDDEEDDE
jgi:hypothetical protein